MAYDVRLDPRLRPAPAANVHRRWLILTELPQRGWKRKRILAPRVGIASLREAILIAAKAAIGTKTITIVICFSHTKHITVVICL